MKIIVAGSRDFTDYKLLESSLDALIDTYPSKEVEIVSGTARGADSLGERYAKIRGFILTRFPAEWDKYGKQAGFIRNRRMAEYVTDNNKDSFLVAFWDGKSRGTKNMIDISKGFISHVHVIYY